MLRALGATRAQAALAASLPGAFAVLGGVILAVAGAVALSPLAPVGPVRGFDPHRGIQVDGLVLGAGAALLAIVLLGLLTVMAARAVRRPAGGAANRSAALARAAASAGLPAAVVVGTRNALEPGSGLQAVPVRATLLGSIAAVTAVVAAVVFGASLTGLIAQPVRYGWSWDLLIQAEGGYGNFPPGAVNRLIQGQPSVAAWSEFAFAQLPIDGRIVPVLGLQRHTGSVQPPTTSGRTVAGNDQIALGSVTLHDLGKRIGDSVHVGAGSSARTLTITGTVTAVVRSRYCRSRIARTRRNAQEAALLSIEGDVRGQPPAGSQAVLDFPSAVAITWLPAAPRRSAPNWSTGSCRPTQMEPLAAPTNCTACSPPRSSTPRRWVVSRWRSLSAWPLPPSCRWPYRADVCPSAAPGTGPPQGAGHDPRPDHGRYRLADHIDSADRHRRRQAAGNSSGPLGVAQLAGSLGTIQVTEVPVLVLLLGFAMLVATGNLLTSAPAAVAARTRAADALRGE